jgi:DNA-directed RNA polymerase specialized sigma24 family protein
MPQAKEDPTALKIDKILRILAVIATKGMNQRQQIAVLHQARLQPKEIADLLGTSSNTVRVELVALRKSKGKKSNRTA